jgi:hypothetical protein
MRREKARKRKLFSDGCDAVSLVTIYEELAAYNLSTNDSIFFEPATKVTLWALLSYDNVERWQVSLACKGDTLAALWIWFHLNLGGIPNRTDDFCFLFVSFYRLN